MSKQQMSYQHFIHKHLLDIDSLSPNDINLILETAGKNIEINSQINKKQHILKGRTLINLFFENSTRTRTSFELAGKRLGADVINMNISSSAIKKGETLIDTAMTLNAMNPDFIVIRHNLSGAVYLLSQKVKCSIINGGDGAHEHPTQALLDALTIMRHKKRIDGLKVAICGDILHSRVARSNIKLLKKMGAHVNLIAPPTLLPMDAEILGADKIYFKMTEGIKDADIIMMLRIQQERMNGNFIPSIREYFHLYGLDYEKLSYAKKDALVMHPGPINRGVELDSQLADDIDRSVILSQVEIGIAIRQAILELLSRQNNEI
ncbi:MAG: aspartate carbamoyltransferase catalytic subunit [Pseudomonadota bacterium]